MADDLLKAALLERAKRELAARQSGASSKPRSQALMDEYERAEAAGDHARADELLREATYAATQDGTAPDSVAYNPATGGMEDMALRGDRGRLNAAAQGLGQGVSFGGMDEMVGFGHGLLGPGTYKQNRDYALASMRGDLAAGRRDYPFTAIGSEVLGSGSMVGAAGNALRIPQAARLGGKVAQGGVSGAGMGGLYGALSGEGGPGNRATNAGLNALAGGIIGAAIPLAGAGVRRIAQSRAGRRAVAEAARGAPSSDELRALGNQLYQQVDDAGVQIKPEAFDRMRSGTRDFLRTNTGFDELPGPDSLTPRTSRVMRIMDEAGARMADEPTAALPMRSLDQMRRQAGAAASNIQNSTDQKAGLAVIDQLDDFVQRLGPDDVVGGDVEALKTALPKAREVWGRMSRSQTIDDAIEASQDYLGGGASGVRNQIARILRNPKLSRGFSAAEKQALRSALRGGFVEQAVGLAGGGIGRIAQAAGGMAAGGPGGAVAGLAAGQGARNLSEAMAMRSIEQVRGAIASGALRNPQVQNALAIAGRGAERLTNRSLFGVLPQTSNALSGLLQGR